MTNKRLLLLLILPLLMLAGCAKDKQADSQTEGGDIDFTIAFAGATDPSTRVSIDEAFLNAWEEGDQIGIFATNPATDAAVFANVAVIYDADSETWSVEETLYWPQGVASLDFLAYYPYDEEYTDPDDIQAFSVKADQTGGGFESSIVMTAETNGVTKAAPTVALTFYHAAALVQFKVDDAVGLIDPATPITVTLRGVNPAPLATDPATAENITMHRVETANPDAMVFRALVAPQTLTKGKRMFLIEQGDVEMLSSALTDDVTLSAGGVTKFTQSSPWPDVAATIKFGDGSTDDITVRQRSGGLYEIAFGGNGSKLVYSVTIKGNEYLVGRKDNETVTLRTDPSTGTLQFRAADTDGNIPVGTYAEFALINTDANTRAGNYLQEADLDLLGFITNGSLDQSALEISSGVTRQNWVPIRYRFSGSYDGGGHTIANLYINRNQNQVGLFGHVETGGGLSRIGIVSGSVTGTGESVGGVCGYFLAGTITACYNMADVSGTKSVGGVCGVNWNTVTACYNTGTISGNQLIGGVCGYNGSTITACYNTGAVSGNQFIGGVCGYNGSTMTACYFLYRGDGVEGGGGGGAAAAFGSDVWPTDTGDWAVRDSDTPGGYWKNLGGWNGGGTPAGAASTFPKLWWEQ